MEDNFYHLLLTKGKRICKMSDFIDALEPSVKGTEHIISAIYTAYDLIDNDVPMSIKFLTEVYKSFFDTDVVYFRNHRVRITPPTSDYESIYKPAKVEFSRLLKWCDYFNRAGACYYTAAELCWDYWDMQPTHDGNKRLSMILLEALCYRNNMPSIYIPKKDIQTLKIKLFDCDIDGIAKLFEKRS